MIPSLGDASVWASPEALRLASWAGRYVRIPSTMEQWLGSEQSAFARVLILAIKRTACRHVSITFAIVDKSAPRRAGAARRRVRDSRTTTLHHWSDFALEHSPQRQCPAADGRVSRTRIGRAGRPLLGPRYLHLVDHGLSDIFDCAASTRRTSWAGYHAGTRRFTDGVEAGPGCRRSSPGLGR